MRVQRWFFASSLVACLSALGHIPAVQATETPAVQFSIQRFQLDGNRLIDSARIDAALRVHLGPGRNFDTLRQAVESIEALYADAGYSAVRVQLPEQDVTEGTVRLRIIEATLGRVFVAGNRHFDEANIRASVPALVEGEAPRLDRVGASIALANEGFAKQARLTLMRGAAPGLVDAQIRVADDVPWRIAASLDNTGNSHTGYHRLGLVFQHANLLNRDHAFSAQFITSTEHPRDVTIFGVGYKIPLYALGDSVEMAYGHSSVNSGNISTAAGDYGVSGKGDFASLRYNLGLPRWNGNVQKLVFEASRRSFQSQVVPTNGTTSLIPNLSSAPASIGYTLSAADSAFTWSAGLTHVWNLPSGKDGTDSAYNRAGARPGADSAFELWRWHLGIAYRFAGEWRIGLDANGQDTRDLLISGEQFGIGGANSIRGYTEREATNDRGWRASLELSTPSWRRAVGDVEIGTRLVAFRDIGAVHRNRPLAGEQDHTDLASIGLGARLQIGRNVQLRADVAQALRNADSTQDGDVRAHFQFLVLF